MLFRNQKISIVSFFEMQGKKDINLPIHFIYLSSLKCKSLRHVSESASLLGRLSNLLSLKTELLC